MPKSAPVGSFFASRAYLGRSWALLGGYFSILGALGCLLGAIFAPSRVLKRFFAKCWRFWDVLARFWEGVCHIFSTFFCITSEHCDFAKTSKKHRFLHCFVKAELLKINEKSTKFDQKSMQI